MTHIWDPFKRDRFVWASQACAQTPEDRILRTADVGERQFKCFGFAAHLHARAVLLRQGWPPKRDLFGTPAYFSTVRWGKGWRRTHTRIMETFEMRRTQVRERDGIRAERHHGPLTVELNRI